MTIAGSTTLPDYEDINGDYTMNTANNYLEYRLRIKPNLTTADPYVNDIRTVNIEAPNGRQVSARWIQFKIPIESGKMIREGHTQSLTTTEKLDIINSNDPYAYVYDRLPEPNATAFGNA